MKDTANAAQHRIDTGSRAVEILVSATLRAHDGSAQVGSQPERAKSLKVVVHTTRAAQRIDRIRPRKRLIGRVRGRWQRRRSNIAQPVNGEHAINAELCVSGGCTDKRNGGKKENCFAETHVPLVY